MKCRSIRCRIITALTVCAMALPCARRVQARHDTWIEVQSPHFTIISNSGERDARHVAAQFERMRALCEQSFANFRVDAGKPTIVFVLQDEDSIKLLDPAYRQIKGAMHLAGLYHPTYDRNYALVRADILGSGPSPYRVVYHEYMHELLRINYRGLPAWLDEGLAEYWGNSEIENNVARVGMANKGEVLLLQQKPLLPLATLVSVDRTSPLYNAEEHTGIFYSESWVLVHYLNFADEVRDQKLLDKYLGELRTTGDPIEAANRSFGDLSKLEDKLEIYARRPGFLFFQVNLHAEISEKDFTARTLSPAEGLIAQANYLMRARHSPEAIALLHQAESLDPKAPGLHAALGYYHYSSSDYANAQKEFDQEPPDSPNQAMIYVYRAQMLMRTSGYQKDTTPEIRENLKKALALREDFAPAHAFLSVADTKSPETKLEALQEAKRAWDLEPGNMAYLIDFGKALLANGNLSDAKLVAQHAEKTATTPGERNQANNFLRQINQTLNPDAKEATSATAVENPPVESSPHEQAPSLAEVEGTITELLCGHPPAVLFTLVTANEQLLLQAKDIGKVEIREGAGTPATAALPCTSWKDRKAKVTYLPTPDGPARGEVKIISFD